MESSIEQLLTTLAKQHENRLTINERDELAWLVSLLFTEEFYGKNNQHLHYNPEKKATYFQRITDFITSHKEAKKCLAAIISELVYDEGEAKPEKPELERVDSLKFFYWAENRNYSVPKKVVDGLKWLMQMEHDMKQREAVEKRKFPELAAEKFALLRKEPLWPLDKAILYVNGIYSEEKSEVVMEHVKKKPDLKKLGVYITQAYKSGRLAVIEHGLVKDWNIQPDEISHVTIESGSAEPEQFIAFAKNLPLSFPMLEAKPTAQIKTSKYELNTKDTNTLFKLIAGMATTGYGYNPESLKNAATSDIERDTGITAKTAKKWIDKAIEIKNGLHDGEDA